MFLNPTHIDPSLDSRSVTFENPTGSRGAGGQTFDGRKGRPSTTIAPGDTVVLADIARLDDEEPNEIEGFLAAVS